MIQRLAPLALPSLVLAFALPFGAVAVGESSLELRRPEPRYRLGRPGLSPSTLVQRDRFVPSESSRAPRDRFAAFLPSPVGEGGGATVEDLVLVQTGFLNAECACLNDQCNVVLMLWTESGFEPDGVVILVDGTPIGTVGGLDAANIPGTHGVNITGMPPGTHTFRIESTADGSFSERTIDVLDDQPFSDPTSVSCGAGPADGPGTCRLDVDVVNPGPMPTFYFVDLDDSFLGTVGGDAMTIVVDSIPTGEHCVSLQGAVEASDGVFYQGCEVEECCTLECADTPCDPPFDLLLCQSGYFEDGGLIRTSWVNGESPYSDAVILALDDAPLGSLAGDANSAIVTTTLGKHSIAVEGDCGADGLSGATTDPITLLAESPHPDPIVGDITQAWTPDDGGTTTATWTLGEPSAFIDAYVLSGGELFFLGVLPGSETTISVFPTVEEDTIVVQFFTFVDRVCYGSELLAGSDEARVQYIRADFNASGDLDLSDPVKTLNFLFTGGPGTTCEDAADSNSDGELNIADPTYTLGWLFLGGPPPEAPFPDCGAMPIVLGCESFDVCE